MRLSSVTVALVGDLMPQRPFLGNVHTPGSAGVIALLEAADLVMANLECPLTTRGAPADKLVAFRSNPSLARDLKAAGVDVVTLANNHMLDYGLDGMYDTAEALSGAGVAPVGAGRTLAEALNPAVREVSGARVAFLGVATTLPVGSAAAPDRPGIAPIHVTTSYVVDPTSLDETPGIAPTVETRAWPEDVEKVADALVDAKRRADFCIVGIHWGVPNGWVAQFQDPIASYQRPLARALVEAGADAVVGHHPHVLHGIELIEGRPVFYSLGNFLFHTLRVGVQPVLRRPDPPYNWRSLRSPVNLDSAIALVTFEGGRASRTEIVPVLINDAGDPELAVGDDAGRILRALSDLSAPLGAQLTIEGGRGHVI